MKREEAIQKIKNGDWRKTESNIKSNIESICDIINQINESYTNDYNNLCYMLEHFELEDMTDGELCQIRNKALEFVGECSNVLRNRGL